MGLKRWAVVTVGAFCMLAGALIASGQVPISSELDATLQYNHTTHKIGVVNPVSSDQKDALSGTSGTPSLINKYVTAADTSFVGGGVPSGRLISTTGPLSGGGDLSTNRTLSIPAATSSANGYLSSIDWSTFNSKVSTARSISTTAPLAGGGDLSANRTLSIPAATTSVNGYLSSTDWTTFNGKVATSRSISTTAPLSGGGDLSTNRTLSMHVADASNDGYLSHLDWITFNSGGGGGAVSSVFTRTGAVVAVSGDYTAAQVTGAVANTRAISAGTGLTGGGDLSTDRTLSMADMAADTLKGNNTGLSAAPADLTVSQVKTLLAYTTTDISAVPTSRTISTTAPLAGGGDLSANRTLSIPVATTSANGYLSSTDWTTFNNKVSTSRSISTTSPLTGGGDLSANRTFAINDASTSAKGATQLLDSVSSTSITLSCTPNAVKTAYDLASSAETDAAAAQVTANAAVPQTRTIGTTAPLAGGGDLSTNRTLSMPAANGSQDGYLTASDWTTFSSPSAGGAASTLPNLISSDTTLGANNVGVVPYALNINTAIGLTIGSGSEVEVLGTTRPNNGTWQPSISVTALSHPLDDYFTTSTLASRWVTWDPGSIQTVSIDHGWLSLAAVAGGTSRAAGVYVTAPDSEYVVYTQAAFLTSVRASSGWAGLMVLPATADSSPSTAAMAVNTMGWNNTTPNINWVDNYGTGFSLGTGGTGASVSDLWPYLRIRVKNTTFSSDGSPDARSWFALDSRTLSFTPARVGLQIQSNSTSTAKFKFFKYYGGPGTSVFDATFIGGTL